MTSLIERSVTPQKELKLWVGRMMRMGSIPVTRYIAQRYGKILNFNYVGGYPKSGTTWVARMFAHYLDVPLVDFNYLPNATQNSLIHHHWNYDPAFDHSIQVIRDGRDVMVSLYVNLMKNYIKRTDDLRSMESGRWIKWAVENIGDYSAVRRRLLPLYGSDGLSLDPANISANLPRFIEAELHRPFLSAAKLPWHQHVASWKSQSKSTIFVKYEDLLVDGMKTMQHALETFLCSDVNVSEVEYTLRRYSFKKKTGREPGVEDSRSFARKGISGDWKNYFTKESRQVFASYAGDALIELGYEYDRNWIEES